MLLNTPERPNASPFYPPDTPQSTQSLQTPSLPIIVHKIQIPCPVQQGIHVFIIDPILSGVIPTTKSQQTQVEPEDIPLPSYSTILPYLSNKSSSPDINLWTTSTFGSDDEWRQEKYPGCETESVEIQQTEVQVGSSKCTSVNEGISITHTTPQHPITKRPGKPERNFICQYCSREFNSNRDLSSHERIHRNEKPYCCPICKKTFRMSSHLKAHLYIHGDEKTFKCSECGNCYRQKSTLQAHKKIHDPDNLHLCSVCGKEFKLKNYLKIHLNTHCNNNPYICSCGKAFKRKWYLKEHFKRMASSEHNFAPESLT